jgi:hypothetical protein
MNQSIQYRVEDAIALLFSAPTNIYVTNRVGGRLFPYVTISASINSQLLVPYSGVYDMNVEVNYSDSAAYTAQEAFDSVYCTIFEALYSASTTLTAKIQNGIIATKVHMARITSQEPTIRTEKRAWQRGLTINVIATPQ